MFSLILAYFLSLTSWLLAIILFLIYYYSDLKLRSFLNIKSLILSDQPFPPQLLGLRFEGMKVEVPAKSGKKGKKYGISKNTISSRDVKSRGSFWPSKVALAS